jgi:hypothetical protein
MRTPLIQLSATWARYHRIRLLLRTLPALEARLIEEVSPSARPSPLLASCYVEAYVPFITNDPGIVTRRDRVEVTWSKVHLRAVVQNAVQAT